MLFGVCRVLVGVWCLLRSVRYVTCVVRSVSFIVSCLLSFKCCSMRVCCCVFFLFPVYRCKLLLLLSVVWCLLLVDDCLVIVGCCLLFVCCCLARVVCRALFRCRYLSLSCGCCLLLVVVVCLFCAPFFEFCFLFVVGWCVLQAA